MIETEIFYCPECGQPFESLHSAAQHGWKSTDHDADSLDEALLGVVEHNDGVSMTTNTDTNANDDTVTSGNGAVDDASPDESESPPPTVTDGESTVGDGTVPDGNDTTGDGTVPDGESTTPNRNDTAADGTATDGGERFPTPAAADDAVDGDTVDDGNDDGEPCPGCGEPLPVDDVEPGVYTCSDCGHRVRVTA